MHGLGALPLEPDRAKIVPGDGRTRGGAVLCRAPHEHGTVGHEVKGSVGGAPRHDHVVLGVGLGLGVDGDGGGGGGGGGGVSVGGG